MSVVAVTRCCSDVVAVLVGVEVILLLVVVVVLMVGVVAATAAVVLAACCCFYSLLYFMSMSATSSATAFDALHLSHNHLTLCLPFHLKLCERVSNSLRVDVFFANGFIVTCPCWMSNIIESNGLMNIDATTKSYYFVKE